MATRAKATLTCGLFLLASCGRGTEAPPAPPPPASVLWPAYSTTDAVRAIAVADDGTVYVGGNFTRMGPMTGSGVPLALDDGQPLAAFPKVDGLVLAIAPDGAGGWYVGGSFARIGGESRANLAHVLADGTLDARWAPAVDGTVEALAVDGGVVYVGGSFGALGGEPRTSVGAVDAEGLVTAWAPQLSRPWYVQVNALVVRAGTVYLGGVFDAVNGEGRSCLAAVGTDGTLAAWNPSVETTPSYQPRVGSLALVGDTVYVAGFFESVGGAPRSSLAAVDAAGAVTPWNPLLAGWIAHPVALAADADTLYLGGAFETVDGQPRTGLAAFDASGALTPWHPILGVPGDAPPDGNVGAIAARSGVVYVGGYFGLANGLPRSQLAAFDAATGETTPWDPDLDVGGAPFALAADAGAVYAGGSFRWVGKATKRVGLAAIDPAGRVTAWNPGVASSTSDDTTWSWGSRGSVHALAVVGGTLYVAGDFASVGGLARHNLAAVDASGAVTSWNPGAYAGPVYAMAASADTLYLGGAFSNLGGQVRGNLGAVRTSGAVTAWAPQANGLVTSLAVQGERVYAGGYFTAIGDQARSNLAAIGTDGALLPWGTVFSGAAGFASPGGTPTPPTGVWALAVSGTTVYVSGDFDTVGGQPRERIAALDASGATTGFYFPLTGYSYGPMHALAVGQGRILAAGQFRERGDSFDRRPAYAEIDPGSTTSGSMCGLNLFSDTTLEDLYGGSHSDAVAVRDGVAYVGGRFWGIPSTSYRRWNLAALGADGVLLLDWDPNAQP